MLCDPTGDYAILEYLDGKLLIHHKTGVPALANAAYSDSEGDFSERFGLTLKDNVKTPIQSIFAIMLDNGGEGKRGQWTVVRDLLQRRLYISTKTNRAISHIDLKKIDFSKTKKRTTITLFDKTYSGDITGRLIHSALVPGKNPIRHKKD